VFVVGLAPGQETRAMLMRQLHPEPADAVSTSDAYAVPHTSTAHLRVNMVSSIDGAAAIDGRVGTLSGPADGALLHELRTLCDVLLVGAGTIRAEGYAPLRLTDEEQQRRTRAGMQPVPRLAVVTRALELDLTAPVFTEATARPLLFVSDGAPSSRRDEAASVADVVVAGQGDVGLSSVISELARMGLPRILSEGGPQVLASMYAHDLVDELCLAVAPMVAAGGGLRITAGPALEPPRTMRLAHVLEHDGFLFLRYSR
jgi:riboflavin biosynthesis pyrimidine reductase